MRRPARLAGIPGFGIDEVAEAAGDDPEVLRLENLDTDLPVPDGVVAATRRAVGVDEYNSYLPFDGRADLKAAIAAHFGRRSRTTVDPSQITITGGDGDGLNNALNATTDVGDEVIVTDPTYAGIVNRVRLVGAPAGRPATRRGRSLAAGPGPAAVGDHREDPRHVVDESSLPARRPPERRRVASDRECLRGGGAARRAGHSPGRRVSRYVAAAPITTPAAKTGARRLGLGASTKPSTSAAIGP